MEASPCRVAARVGCGRAHVYTRARVGHGPGGPATVTGTGRAFCFRCRAQGATQQTTTHRTHVHRATTNDRIPTATAILQPISRARPRYAVHIPGKSTRPGEAALPHRFSAAHTLAWPSRVCSSLSNYTSRITRPTNVPASSPSVISCTGCARAGTRGSPHSYAADAGAGQETLPLLWRPVHDKQRLLP
jgi:hypothetical protein